MEKNVDHNGILFLIEITKPNMFISQFLIKPVLMGGIYVFDCLIRGFPGNWCGQITHYDLMNSKNPRNLINRSQVLQIFNYSFKWIIDPGSRIIVLLNLMKYEFLLTIRQS